MTDDTWKLKFRILRQRLVEMDRPTSIPGSETKPFQNGWKFAVYGAVKELDEMLDQTEEERLR